MLLLLPLATATTSNTAWVVESAEFAAGIRAALSTEWTVVGCGAAGADCEDLDTHNVSVVIGRAGALELDRLPELRLVQGASYFQTDGGRVPHQAAIAEVGGFWPAQGADQIAEWVIAAIFENQYRLGATSRAFSSCAFASDSPHECAADTTATNHTMVSDLTIGVCGYGHIGARVAQRAAALGSTVVATTLDPGPGPAPAPLKWLSDDNDRLFREADVVVVTVPGSGHPGTVGLINKTSLALMRPAALLVPVSAGPIDFGDLEEALKARPSLRAVVDIWPAGCWHYPNVSCGAPLGAPNWPAPPSLGMLPNVLPLPGVSMRDAKFWRHSAAFVAANLDALALGKPLAGIVRNASAAAPVMHAPQVESGSL